MDPIEIYCGQTSDLRDAIFEAKKQLFIRNITEPTLAMSRATYGLLLSPEVWGSGRVPSHLEAPVAAIGGMTLKVRMGIAYGIIMFFNNNEMVGKIQC